jgi:hypothetical protein
MPQEADVFVDGLTERIEHGIMRVVRRVYRGEKVDAGLERRAEKGGILYGRKISVVTRRFRDLESGRMACVLLERGTCLSVSLSQQATIFTRSGSNRYRMSTLSPGSDLVWNRIGPLGERTFTTLAASSSHHE